MHFNFQRFNICFKGLGVWADPARPLTKNYHGIEIHGKFTPVERLSFLAKHSRSMALDIRTS